jgi:large subunit ribosomal protein L18e
MKSKTKIGKQIQKKTNSELVGTILAAKKHELWIPVASVLAGPRRNFTNLNIGEIDKIAKEGETVIVPGKVLSEGEISKKIKVVSLGFSEKAKEKLEKAKISTLSIEEEIKKNPTAKGIRILNKQEIKEK